LLVAWRRRTFRSLANANYRSYFLGSAVSVSGTWMQRVAQDWLVLQLSHSGVALGVASSLQFAPVLVLGAWGGAVVDRVDRRRLLIVTQATSALLAAVLGALTVAGVVTLWMVYVLALALGVVTVFDSPARQTFVAEMVGTEHVVNAQSLYSSVHNGGRLVGPALAGIVIAWLGVAAAFALNALSFIPMIVALVAMNVGALVRTPPLVRAPRQVRDGFRYLWGNRDLRAALILVAIVGVFGQNFRVVLPLLAQDTYRGGAQSYGYLTAALGLGAVAGALVTAGWKSTSLRGLRRTCLGFGVVNLIAAAVPSLGPALVVMVGVGVANIVFNTVARTLLIMQSEPTMRGRVISLYNIVFLGSTPFGGVIVGWACESWGARTGLVLAGLPAAAAAALVFAPRRDLALQALAAGFGDVVAPYRKIVERRAEVGELRDVLRRDGVGPPAGLRHREGDRGQRVDVERTDDGLFHTVTGHGDAVPLQHADRPVPHRGHHLVGELGPADENRAGIDRNAVERHPHRRDVVRADDRPQFKPGHPADQDGGRVGVHHRVDLGPGAQQLAVDGQLVRHLVALVRLDEPAVEVGEPYVGVLGEHQALVGRSPAANEHTVVAGAYAHVPQRALDEPLHGEDAAGLGHRRPQLLDTHVTPFRRLTWIAAGSVRCPAIRSASSARSSGNRWVASNPSG
jgi:MFS family permease